MESQPAREGGGDVRRSDEMLEEILALAREYALRRWGQVPRYLRFILPDGLEQQEIVPAVPQRVHQDDAGDEDDEAVTDDDPVTDWHSDDFARVRRGGVEYALAPKQAAVVAALWDAREQLALGLGDGTRSQSDLLAIAGSDCGRLRDLFARSPAWRALVEVAGDGMYRLGPGGA